MGTMKAAVCKSYGPPEFLKVRLIKKTVPAPDEVLIKIHAASVIVADSRVRGFRVPPSFWLPARLAMGISKPRHSVLGSELAGEIVDKGPSVTQFNVGDPVFANSSHDCFGANAEFICIKESGCIARKPWDLSFEESAMLTFGGITALEFLRKAKLQAGEKILIYGASGSVGTSAVQLAKYFGAEVTAVCSNKNALLVKSLGADMVIDYHKENWFDLTDRFDVVFDVVGKAPEKELIRLLKPEGRFLHAVSTPAHALKMQMRLMGTRKLFYGGSFKINKEQIEFIRQLAEKGSLKPVVDQAFPLEQIVEAHRYVDSGHKRGNVVITISK